MLLSRPEMSFDFGGARLDPTADRQLLGWIFNQFLYGEVTGIQCGHWLYSAPDLEAARLMAHRCMWLAQQGIRVSKEAAAALLFTARAAMRAADEALQIHGGWGYLTDFEVEKMWRNAKLGEIGAGTNEIRQLLIARELLGMR